MSSFTRNANIESNFALAKSFNFWALLISNAQLPCLALIFAAIETNRINSSALLSQQSKC